MNWLRSLPTRLPSSTKRWRLTRAFFSRRPRDVTGCRPWDLSVRDIQQYRRKAAACTGAGVGTYGHRRGGWHRKGLHDSRPAPDRSHGGNAEDAAFLREEGGEYGATTGRERRCGWFRWPVHAAPHVPKRSDTAGAHETGCSTRRDPGVRDCEGGGVPACLEDARPVYTKLPGWRQDIRSCRRWKASELCKSYVEFLEEKISGGSRRLISVGPGRREIIARGEFFTASRSCAPLIVRLYAPHP